MTLAHIRAATRDGLDEAVELFARLDELEAGWRVFTARDHLAGDTRARYGRLIGSHEGLIVVAEAEGHLVGLGVAELTTPSSSYDKAVVLSNLFVRSAYRRQGIGRAITAELMCFATRLGVPRLVLKGFAANEAAAGFWTSLGFRPRLTQFSALVREMRQQLTADELGPEPTPGRTTCRPDGTRRPLTHSIGGEDEGPQARVAWHPHRGI
jgi:ribosomal protein S18 acetylase RimI-like enzyme